ncbi:MAG TPA: sulfur carrier protein ThiS [Steroidobacteraceae bacterium]|nr:sulfur carrier protein ThiS [Steroidobacteraceae bacterium]
MRIRVNGAWRETSAVTLGSVLQELGYGEAVVATAVNGEFVPIGSRPSATLTEGDQLEVLAPMQGG